MSEKRRKFDLEFREGAVRIVRETGKPIAQVARPPRPAMTDGTDVGSDCPPVRPSYYGTGRSGDGSLLGEIETDVVEGAVDDIQRCLWTLRLRCTMTGIHRRCSIKWV